MDDKRYSIEVSGIAVFVADQSDLMHDQYAFSYEISLVNTGLVPAQLISRHWIITDANDEVQQVDGIGVVGEQPLLAPGEHFQYRSGVTLRTPWGAMQGSYRMLAEDGTHFEAPIPRFELILPRVLH